MGRCALLFAVLTMAATTATAQEGPIRLPSLALGAKAQADFRLLLQLDWRRLHAPEGPEPSSFDVRRARVDIEGTILDRIEYQVEIDGRRDATPWRDVFANLRIARALEVRGGRFKMPFGLDQLTGSKDLDFAYRALLSDSLAPGRDLGAMAHGVALDKRIKYQVGVFHASGDNTRRAERASKPPAPTVGGRLVLKPWDGARRSILSKTAAGVSFTSGRVPAGPHNVDADSFADAPIFHDVHVNGQRRRVGAELEWRYGPTAIRAERVHVTDERRGQGTDDDDLSAALSQGWYLSGSWLLTGEKKTDRIKPASSVLRGGPGAIELVARIEEVRFGSVSLPGVAPSRDRRARVIAHDADRAITGGLNWYPLPTVKLQFNVMRERLDRRGTPVNDGAASWGRVLRLQVAL